MDDKVVFFDALEELTAEEELTKEMLKRSEHKLGNMCEDFQGEVPTEPAEAELKKQKRTIYRQFY